MAAPVHPHSGYPAGGWIPARADVDRTIALLKPNLDVNAVWLLLAEERRRYATWAEVRGFMLGWARRDAEAARPNDEEQPLLPGFDRAAAQKGKVEMSRIRSVHPSLWTEEDFVACSFPARLLLLGLRNEADDHGVFEWRPKSLKLRLMPSEDLAIEPLLDELVERGQVAAYEVDGHRYGICLSWEQQPQHPSYRFPLPPAQNSVTVPIGITEGSATLHPEEKSKVEESKGRASRAKPAPPPQDLPDEWREEARRQRVDQSEPEADFDEQWRRFRNLNAEAADTPARWRGRWLNWALEAKAAPNSHADPPVAKTGGPSASWLELTAFWAGLPGAEAHRIEDRIALKRWALTGGWGGNIATGPEPDSGRCYAPKMLVDFALRHRAAMLGGVPATTTDAEAQKPGPRRKQRSPSGQRAMLLPLPGGVAGDAAIDPPSELPAAELVRVAAGGRTARNR